jgi:hypothetical protein
MPLWQVLDYHGHLQGLLRSCRWPSRDPGLAFLWAVVVSGLLQLEASILNAGAGSVALAGMRHPVTLYRICKIITMALSGIGSSHGSMHAGG